MVETFVPKRELPMEGEGRSLPPLEPLPTKELPEWLEGLPETTDPDRPLGEVDPEIDWKEELDQLPDIKNYMNEIGSGIGGDRGYINEEGVEYITCRNERCEGQCHPETGVPFKRVIVEYDGKIYEGVFPEFESKFDADIPEDKYHSSDAEHIKECNSQLKDAVENDPDLRAKFSEEQLEQIENGDTPDGYTWHHNEQPGKIQLVDTDTHSRTGHTGGRSIWGGGREART